MRKPVPSAGNGVPPSTRVVKGPLRRFNAERGYGFIEPEDGQMADVLLHISQIKQSGRASIEDEHIVTCEVTFIPGKGWKVKSVLSVSAPPPFLKAEVRWYDPKRTYGFVTILADNTDAFVATRTLERWGLKDLREGQIVYVRTRPGRWKDDGPEVFEIRLG